MRILVYGAGVIGSLFAGKLKEAGHDVTVLARGERLRQIRTRGLVLREARTGRETSVPVGLIETLAPDDLYDLIIVPVQRIQIEDILPVLARNGSPDVLIAVNNPAGYDEIRRHLGRRALAGFPGAGGSRDGHAVTYILAPSLIQANTFGEMDGRITPRLRRIVRLFRAAGLSAAICRNMDAWQKTHVAWVSPVANALHAVGGSNYDLARRPDVIRCMIRAVREGFRVLRELGIPVTPGRLNLWRFLPEGLLVLIWQRILATRFAEYIMASHAKAAREEMSALAEEFKRLAEKASIATPAMDRLRCWQETDDHKPSLISSAFADIRRVLWAILFANLAVAAVKIVAGRLIGSNSLSADGIHSLTDGSSNIIGLIGIHFASRPVDADHPYGHKKFESLAGLFIAGTLLTLGIRIISTAVNRFADSVTPAVTLESLLALLATLAVNVAVSRYELKKGRELGSDILVSDSYHTRSDIYVSIGVLATLIGIRLGLPPIIDPIVSLLVSIVILHAAFEILRPTIGILADKAAIDPEVIREIVTGFAQVEAVHKIRSRGRGDDIQIDLHIMLDPAMSVAESHELIHAIARRINEKLGGKAHTEIHVEPYQPA